MNIQERFERFYEESRGLPVGTCAAHRHATKDGYRLPDMASHYRTFCAALQELPEIELPEPAPNADPQVGEPWDCGYNVALEECRAIIEAAGLKVKP